MIEGLNELRDQLQWYAEQGYHTLGWHLLEIKKIVEDSPQELEWIEQFLTELKKAGACKESYRKFAYRYSDT